jgi:hypothetical protein
MRAYFGIAVLLLLMVQVFRLPLQSLALEAQRDYIARTYCINLDEPELLCSGQCFIDQKLTEVIKEDVDDVPTPQLALDWETKPYLPAIHDLSLLLYRPCAYSGWHYLHPKRQLYLNPPFAPPRCLDNTFLS